MTHRTPRDSNRRGHNQRKEMGGCCASKTSVSSLTAQALEQHRILTFLPRHVPLVTPEKLLKAVLRIGAVVRQAGCGTTAPIWTTSRNSSSGVTRWPGLCREVRILCYPRACARKPLRVAFNIKNLSSCLVDVLLVRVGWMNFNFVFHALFVHLSFNTILLITPAHISSPQQTTWGISAPFCFVNTRPSSATR